MKNTRKKEENKEAGNLPLFYTSPQVIAQDVHASAKLRSNLSMDFARKTNSIPLSLADFMEASMVYPIVFSNDEFAAPIAIVGLESENYFVDNTGKWEEGCYVPTYVRRFPFLFAENPDNDQLTLCIEEHALEWSADAEGIKLYEGEAPSEFVKNALEFCSNYHQQLQQTRLLSEALKKWGILKPSVSNISLTNGRKITLNGFQIIDAEKLQAMQETNILEGFKNGLLSAVFCVMQSQLNWRRLLEMGNKREPAVS